MSTDVDLIAACTTSLAASTTTEGEVAIMYLASARVAFEGASQKLASLERMICARERELSHAMRARQELLAMKT